MKLPSSNDVQMYLGLFNAVMHTAEPFILAGLAGISVRFGKYMVKKVGEAATEAKTTAEAAAEAAVVAKNTALATNRLITRTSNESAERQNTMASDIGKVKVLVNGQYGLALRQILEQAIRIAELSEKPEDIAAVELARRNLEDHEAKIATLTAPQ